MGSAAHHCLIGKGPAVAEDAIQRCTTFHSVVGVESKGFVDEQVHIQISSKKRTKSRT